MRLRHIEIFHAIYTTGSITNAAKILHVSQPSVSKVLSHAELQLGFQLFNRVKGRLTPTEEAKMLFDDVDKIYQQLRTIKNTANNIKKSEFGSIKIGLTPALGFDSIPAAVANFHRDHPAVNIQLQTIHNESVMHTLLERKCDLAIVFSPDKQPGLNEIELARSELTIVYPKALFPHCPTKLSFAELSEHEFIDIGDSGPLGDLLWTRMLEENVNITPNIRVQTYFLAARIVAQDIGLCVVDKFTALGNLSPNTAMASFDPPLEFNISALHLENNNLSSANKEFLSYLTSVIS
ncbi:LysR family transcriptional regulator [Shewanella hanedai]|uniref:LysR family transcriptional regulator n=1 Tax=Shewanella hanedai TaxID=25 RepID=A0A553JPB5_SHEHA|nr:LysR family transcriptional regulator [Shewanella hanedai]TRY14308.1 LysR family transcriptional regulator [Shewanella hanedai]GGI81177.1 LysR family transcriptional regulator [Shewanella hanedai]